jgi:hypothetical protein
MQIEKAYLFARQISGGATPPTGNVYFENGLFNPALAYENTSFSYESITRGDFNDYNNGGRMVVYNIIKNDIGNGKIFQFLGTNAGQFQIVGKNIVSDIANPNLDDMTRFSTDFGLLYLPVRLPANTYSKLCARIKLHDKIDSSFNVHLYMAAYSEGYGMYGTVWKYDFSETMDVSFDIETNSNDWRDDSPYIGIAVGACKTTEIEKIWFE